MIRIGIGCDGAQSAAGRHCYFIEVPEHINLDEAEGWIDVELQNREWISIGGKHFCPEHNPAAKGAEVTVRPGEYTEIAPGVRVRLPVGTPTFELTVEVQTQYRECHGCVGEVCGGGNGVYEPGTEWAAWHKPDEKGR